METDPHEGKQTAPHEGEQTDSHEGEQTDIHEGEQTDLHEGQGGCRFSQQSDRWRLSLLVANKTTQASETYWQRQKTKDSVSK